MKFWQKTVTFIASVSLLVNSFSAPLIVLAQDVSDPTPTPTEEPVVTPDPSIEETATPTPTVEATTAPEVTIEPISAVENIQPEPQQSQPENQETTNENAQPQSPPEESSIPSVSPEPTIIPVQPVEGGTLSAEIVETSLFSDNLEQNSWFQVITDKLDYSPTEAAVITGSGFTSGGTYILTVSSSDEPLTSTTVEVTADSNGSFTYIYQLDGIYRPNYLVEVNDGESLLASTTFTDGQPASGDLQQCRNGDSDDPNDCLELGGSEGWVGGNAGGSNSHYVEGFSIPYRQIMTNLPIGTQITLTMGYDIKHSGANAIDFLTHYDRLESHSPFGHSAENIGPLSGVVGVSATVGTYAIPAPSSAGSPVAGQPTARFNSLPAGERLMTLYGGSISNIAYVTQGDLTASQAETQIAITFTVDSSTAVLAWGGHIAREVDWGTNMSAGGISGSPYHMRQTSWFGDTDGDGDNDLPNLGNTDRSLSADAVVPPSSITFIKDASPDNAQDFVFTTTGTGLSNFSLDDDVDGTLPNSVTFNNLLEGTYTATETAVPGWSLGSPIVCQSDGTGSTYSQTTGGVSIDLTAGENVTCTFVNTQVTGSITIVKNSIPDDAQDFSFSGDLGAFSLDDDANNTLQNSQTFSSLVGGTYVVVEGVQTGWDLTNIVCNDTDGGTTVDLITRTATIDLDHGQNLTCTFTNTKRGHIIVDKVTDPSGDSQSFDFVAGGGSYANFSLTDAATPNDQPLVPGSYSITETVPSVWDLTSTSCVSSIQDTETAGALELDAGETITCTFNNQKDANVVIVKSTVPNTNQTSFEFDPSWTTNFFLSHGQSHDSGDLNPGNYNVSEIVPLVGWDLTSAVCSDSSPVNDISLQAGETVTCTFTNTQRGSIYGYKYDDENGDGVDDGDWTPVVDWVIELWQGDVKLDETQTDSNGYYSFTNLVQGVYQLIEVVLGGWTNVTPDTLGVTLDPGEGDGPNDFVNTRYGSIRVVKQTEPDGSLENFEFDSNYHNENFFLTDGFSDLSGDLVPGTYSVVELPEAGWDLTSATCDDGSDPSSISLQSGEVVVCTFTNTQRGHVIIQKNAIPDSDQEFTFNNNFGNGNPATFGLIDDDTVGLPSYDAEVLPGEYSVSEDSVSGWQSPETTSCDQGETVDDIDVGPGETVTCTFTNEKLATITLVKNTIGGNGEFDFDATGDGLPIDIDLTTSGGTVSQIFNDLDPDNTYTIAENPTSAWDLTSAICDQGETPDDIDINAGETVTCTFTNTKRGNVTVTKYHDHNADGFQGQDDEQLEGWEIWLDSAAQWTGVSGQVTFSDVEPGGYTLSEQINEGWFQSNITCADSGEIDNDNSHPVTVTSGQTTYCSIGNYQKGSISGQKFNDLNGNGVKDLDEPGLAGWTINLDIDADGDTDLIDITDGNGDYGFINLDPGNYRVREEGQVGWTQTTVNPSDIALTSGDDVTDIDFGNRGNGSIHGRKWEDVDGDGIMNEFGLLSGWTINLYQVYGEGNSLLDSFVTSDGEHFGWYWFDNLVPGNYMVCEELQGGWEQTYPNDNEGCHLVTLPDGNSGGFPELENAVFGPVYDFGNQEQIFGVSIEKSNDKTGGANAGDTVNYTLVVTNNGNQTIYNLDIKDALPGGFSYVLGSTTGDTTLDPSIVGNNLTWEDVTDLTGGASFTIHYQVKIAGDVTAGTYKNFATCDGIVRAETPVIECNVDDSDVPVGQGVSFGGNLSQVLGASTELPATGSSLALLVFALIALGTGFIIKKKYVKN